MQQQYILFQAIETWIASVKEGLWKAVLIFPEHCFLRKERDCCGYIWPEGYVRKRSVYVDIYYIL